MVQLIRWSAGLVTQMMKLIGFYDAVYFVKSHRSLVDVMWFTASQDVVYCFTRRGLLLHKTWLTASQNMVIASQEAVHWFTRQFDIHNQLFSG